MRVYPITRLHEPKPDANHHADADDDRSAVMDFNDADNMDDEGFTAPSAAAHNDVRTNVAPLVKK